MRTVVPSATTSLPSGPAGSASPVDAEPAAAFRGRTTGRVALLLGAALVAALPLVVDPSGWFVYLPARWLVLVLTTLCLVLATLWDRRRPEGLPGGRAWLVLIGVAVVSAATSSAPQVALWGAGDRVLGAATWLVHGALAWTGFAAVRRRADLAVLVKAMAVGVLTVAAVTVAQRWGWGFPAGAMSSHRPGGPFGNANFLGAYCVLGLPVGAGLLLDRSERTGWRAAGAAAALAAIGCAVLSGSRSAWLAVALGAAAMVEVARRAAGPADARARRRIALALLAAVVFGMVVAASTGVADRLDDLAGGTARGRVDTWGVAAEVVQERPLLGWGPEGFAEGATGAVDDVWEQRYGRRLTPDRAHNGLLDVATTLGLVGLVAYLAALRGAVGGVRRALVAGGGSGGPDPAVWGVAIGLGAYLVHQQTLFQLFDVDALAWFLTGALCALGAPLGAPLDAPRALERVTSAPRRGVRAGAITVALALGGVLTVAGVQGVAADRHARAAADSLGGGNAAGALVAARSSLERSPQVLPALVAADAAQAAGTDEALREGLRLVRGAAARTFDDGRLTLAEARLLRELGGDGVTAATGLVEGLVAHDRSRGEAWLLLGDLHADAGDAAAAVASWERAAHLSPRRTAPLERLAPAYEAAGRDRAALDAVRRIETLRGTDAGPLPVDLALLRAHLEVRLGE